MSSPQNENIVDPYETRSETLLHEGRYREWFYKGLTEDQIVYLHQPPRMSGVKTNSSPTVLHGWFNEQPVWVEQAACADADPSVFFTEAHYPEREYRKPDAEWRKFCPQCPVREACLQAARDSGSVGIFGGTLFHYSKRAGKIQEIDD